MNIYQHCLTLIRHAHQQAALCAVPAPAHKPAPRAIRSLTVAEPVPAVVRARGRRVGWKGGAA